MPLLMWGVTSFALFPMAAEGHTGDAVRLRAFLDNCGVNRQENTLSGNYIGSNLK
jgi:hypothetical protein